MTAESIRETARNVTRPPTAAAFGNASLGAYQRSLHTRSLHEPFQRRSTHRHLWARTIALALGASPSETSALVGTAIAPEEPTKQMAAATATAPKTARMMCPLISMDFALAVSIYHDS
jgi:hypothetical protein